MAESVVWHGTRQERTRLTHAVARHCACEVGTMGVRVNVCAAHRMLTEDQRILDGLLFARRRADHLRQQEWDAA
jgi:hypothetical protein